MGNTSLYFIERGKRKGVVQYLADHNNIRKIYLCLDNDIAGNAACENLAEKIPNDKVVMRLVEALLIHGEPLVLQDSSIFKEKKRYL